MARAAVRLNTDPSTVSRQTRMLQRGLRIDLFERTPQGMVPSKAGIAYGREARSILKLAQRAYQSALYISITDVQPFQVGYSPWVHHQILSFLQVVGMPGNELRPVVPRDDNSARLMSRVLRGELHAAFGVMPIAHQYLKVYPLLTEPMGVFLREKHPLAGNLRLSALQLRGERIYWAPRRVNPGFYDYITGYLRSVGFDLSEIREARGIESALEFILHGGGIALAPQSMGALHRSGTTFCLLTDELMKVESCFFASSAESVGSFRFWKSCKRVIHGDLHRVAGAKTIRASGDHS